MKNRQKNLLKHANKAGKKRSRKSFLHDGFWGEASRAKVLIF